MKKETYEVRDGKTYLVKTEYIDELYSISQQLSRIADALERLLEAHKEERLP